jgi:hypothetical protein
MILTTTHNIFLFVKWFSFLNTIARCDLMVTWYIVYMTSIVVRVRPMAISSCVSLQNKVISTMTNRVRVVK